MTLYQECDIYSNVLNITDHCQINLMGTNIKTPCIPLCITALTYAVNYCGYIYGHTDLLLKIVNLLHRCEDPLIKASFFQNLYSGH
jgi:hypothetical protein